MNDTNSSDCLFVRDQLSAYVDGELDESFSVKVSHHLRCCEACSCELAQFQQLSEFVRKAPWASAHPLSVCDTAIAVCIPNWDVIADRLDARIAALNGAAEANDGVDQVLVSIRSKHWKLFTASMVALAASVLFFALLRPIMKEHQGATIQSGVATLNLQPVLEIFGRDSGLALDLLSNQFESKEVDLEQAEMGFGRPTFVSLASRERQLPGEATVASTTVLSFPFCKCPEGQCLCGPDGCGCVACVCERPDGSTYLVLEHCKSQSVSFGDLPVQLVNRDGRQFQQVMVDETQAISFDRPTGRITVVGLRGDAEIETLLASN